MAHNVGPGIQIGPYIQHMKCTKRLVPRFHIFAVTRMMCVQELVRYVLSKGMRICGSFQLSINPITHS